MNLRFGVFLAPFHKAGENPDAAASVGLGAKKEEE